MIKNYNNEHIKDIACQFIEYYYQGMYNTNKPIKADESKQENK